MSSRASYDGRSPKATLRAYSRWTRAAVALLYGFALLALGGLGAAVLLASDPPVTPPVLLHAFALWVAAPAVVAAAIAHACAAEAEVCAPDLILERRAQRLEIPLASIVRVRAWRVPVPQPGFAIELRSGRRLDYALTSRDPLPLLRELETAAVSDAVAHGTGSLTTWIEARAAKPKRRAVGLLLKFPGFALLPTGLLFNVHQQISYGGILGEYHLLGLQSYLTTFATYWSATAIYLLILAVFLRVLAEILCLGMTRAAPSLAGRARRAAELACGVGYWAGVPFLLLLRFLP